MARVCILVNDWYVYVATYEFTRQPMTEAMGTLPVILERSKVGDVIRVELELESGHRWEGRFYCRGW